MELLSLTLQNFKAHRDRHFEFKPGTNAICGENGAGKTSILEAIAWVLFNYRGLYNKEDLIRNGTSSARAKVRFISNRDGRTYEVSRCTTAGYSVYDPQLQAKLDYSRIQEEILPWLRQHLGVLPGTDLAHLFSTTLGIPQGTFTADFLLTPEKRKPVFDRILKVEEYQKVYKDTLGLQRYAEAEEEKLKTAIAQYQETLQGWDALSAKRQDLLTQIQQVEIESLTTQQALTELEAEQAKLREQGEALQTLNRQIETLETQIQTQIQILEQAQEQLEASEQAAALCQTHTFAYQGYLAAETSLRVLEEERKTQINLQNQRQKLVSDLSDRQSKLRGIEQQLAQLDQLERELAAIAPQVLQQRELEQQYQALQAQLQTCQNHQALLTREQQHRQQLQDQAAKLGTEILALQSLESTIQKIPDLEANLARTQQQINRIEAATQFQVELQRLLDQVSVQSQSYAQQVETATQRLQELKIAVPLWAEPLEIALVALQQGDTLQQSVQSTLQEILADLSAQTAIAQLQAQRTETQAQLREAQRHHAQYLTLEAKIQQQKTLEQDIQQSLHQIATLQIPLQAEPEIQTTLKTLTAQLKALNNPLVRQQLLQSQLNQRPKVIAEREAIARSLTQDEAQLTTLDQELQRFTPLVEQLQIQQQARDLHREGYQIYLQHRDRAHQLESQKLSLDAIAKERTTRQSALETTTQDRDRLSLSYDLAYFQNLQAKVQETQAQVIRAQARLPEMQQRMVDLEDQVNQLTHIQVQCKAAEVELKQREKIRRFIVFGRKVFKEAGPRITERYVVNISHEADRLFRELINRPNVSLEWTRDYEIRVREDGHIRRLINLSGGEQMCAALAVRLALLRVLADLDIAFFDEPTTNMDRVRRQHLAGAIANIRSFRQLFVISHDDTFEQVTENVILVEREA